MHGGQKCFQNSLDHAALTDLKFAIKLLVERDKTSQQFNW